MKKVNVPILAAAAGALWLAVPLAAAMRPAWPPETVSGKIAMVQPDRKLVVVKTPSGVPFDLVVTPKTRIQSGDRTIALKDLTADLNKSVSIQFIPERRGDVAKSIQIGG